MKTILLPLLLLTASLPALHAAENLLPPFSKGTAKAGDAVESPWGSSDAQDNDLISVKMGTPDGGKADWVELKDDSPINTANLRILKLEPVADGEFSFEIDIVDGADGQVVISLGIDGVTDKGSRVMSIRFSPGGDIELTSHDESETRASQSYNVGKPQAYRLKFVSDDKGVGVVQLFEGKSTRAIAEMKTPAPLIPITGVRVTTGQSNSHVQCYVRDLVLEKK